MKQILTIVTFAAAITACNTKTETTVDKAAIIAAYQDSVKKAADTAGLAAFQTWKSQNELADARQFNEVQTVAVAAPAVIKTSRTAAPARRTSNTSSSKSGGVSNSGGTMNSESSNTAMRKKGWSKAAKGAAIGTAGGAVIGAVVNKKNRVAGGVIGGVLGAGVGYGVGRGIDKKDGRY